MTVRPTYSDKVYTVVFTKYGGGNASVQHIVHGHSATLQHRFWWKDITLFVGMRIFACRFRPTVNPFRPNVYTVRFLDKDRKRLCWNRKWNTAKVPNLRTGEYRRFVFLAWSGDYTYITEDSTFWRFTVNCPSARGFLFMKPMRMGAAGELNTPTEGQ